MKKILVYFLFLTLYCNVNAQSEKLVFDLSSRLWKMEGTIPGEGIKKEFHKYYPDGAFASVPGDVYTDLWRAG